MYLKRRLAFLLIVLLLLGALPAPTPAAPAAPLPRVPGLVIESELEQTLAADGVASYLIYLDERPDLSAADGLDWIARGRFVADALQETATSSQARVRAYLDAWGIAYEAFWIDNVILVEASDRNTLEGLTRFDEIAALRAPRVMQLIEPQTAPDAEITAGPEPNLARVGADAAWALGFDGEGAVVANIDTGVRRTHDALRAQYRGALPGGGLSHSYNWWDPYGDYAAPADGQGHGSHVMGVMVGDDGGANQIGMAPGADWIACRGCSSTSCTGAALFSCAQWVAAPWDANGQNANPDLRPHVVNNSWGDCEDTYDPWYQGVVNAWHAAGIYPVFSNGNAGNCGYSYPPGPGTVVNPARYGNVTGVGSTGRSNGQYASHSVWGPTDNADTVNPRGYPYLKPQVLAPGVSIRSSYAGWDGSYAGMTGTSMSAPHVAGLVALMWGAAPCLVGNYAATETLIEQTASPIPYDDGIISPGTATVPNNVTGWGEINALAAVLAARQHCGIGQLSGVVTDAATGLVVPHAVVSSIAPLGEPRQVLCDTVGAYQLDLSAGTYTLIASSGAPATRLGSAAVTLGWAESLRLDIALHPATTRHVTGLRRLR